MVLAICLVSVIGLFAFELSRYFLAQGELKTDVEVAALSCQTNLVSLGDPTNADNQKASEQAGLALFQQNSILGQPMTGATLADNVADLNPAPNQAQITFQFLDPLTKAPLNASGAGVSTGVTNPSTAGTLIRATASYAYTTTFGKFIGLGNAQFTLQVSALSGVPKIDLLVLLDISRGMDDDTALTFYQRYEAPTGTDWLLNPNPNGSGIASGLETAIVCPPNDINVLPPHEWDQGSAVANSTCKLYQAQDAKTPSTNNLQMANAMPPGNYCSADPNFATSTGSSSSFLPAPTYFEPDGTLIKNRTSHFIASKHAQHRKSKSIASYQQKRLHEVAVNSEPGLLQLCTKIAGKHVIVNRVGFNKIDNKLSTISFAPQFSYYPLVPAITTGFTGGPASTGGSSNPPPDPNSYVGANGSTYAGQSREPGGNADVGPPVMPIIDGFGCSPSPVAFGPALSNIYTGVFVNGVIGASNSNKTMTINSAATAIEASLGDLESVNAAAKAGDDTGALGVNPQAGWYAFYYNTARQYIEPLMAVVYTLIGFINELAIVSDVHYGFIAFNDTVGADANSVGPPINNSAIGFPYAVMNPDGTSSVTGTYPLPNIQINNGNIADSANQSTIIGILPTLSIWGGRNVTAALTAAYNQLQARGRPGANQAIVLVTCGPPNGNDTPASAITEAGTIGAAGIPVYVVCVAVNTTDDTADDSAYTDTGGNSGGVAAASGHGAKYYRVDFVDPGTAQGQLVSIFGNIARQLVSIVQSNN